MVRCVVISCIVLSVILGNSLKSLGLTEPITPERPVRHAHVHYHHGHAHTHWHSHALGDDHEESDSEDEQHHELDAPDHETLFFAPVVRSTETRDRVGEILMRCAVGNLFCPTDTPLIPPRPPPEDPLGKRALSQLRTVILLT